jgi:hypothetical protein
MIASTHAIPSGSVTPAAAPSADRGTRRSKFILMPPLKGATTEPCFHGTSYTSMRPRPD